MSQFKQQITEAEYNNTELEYLKMPLIICSNRVYVENDPYRLIDGEIFIGEDAYWKLRNNIEIYDGEIYYFRNSTLQTDFKVTIVNKEFIPPDSIK